MARHRNLITYLAAYFFAISAALRYLGFYRGQTLLIQVVVLLAAYFVLLALEPRLSRRSPRYTHLYLAAQTVIIVILALIAREADWFSILFIPLCLQAIHTLPPRTGFGWIGAFVVLMSALMFYQMGVLDGLGVALVNAIAYLIIGVFVAAIREAEEAREQADLARQESQELLVELQAAHQQLRVYADQAEELAVAAERSRLARDLHDSVTQALYSLTLYAEAASRQLAAGALDVVADHLRELRQSAQQALQEMRVLIFELRPAVLETEGLAAALRTRLEAVETRAGLEATFTVRGEGQVPPDVEAGLYRIAQEALNNVLKHAQATQVQVELVLHEDRVVLDVADDGVGFDPTTAQLGGGMGLQSMAERVKQLGGEMSLTSEPGRGTRLIVEVAL